MSRAFPRSWFLTSLVAMLALLVAEPGGAVAAPQGPTEGAAGSRVETPLEDLLRQAALDGRDDPRARAAAMQTFVSERWDLSDRSTPVPIDGGAGEDLESEYNIFTRVASDLDGDGGNDVIVNGSSYPDGPEVLEARSGADGRPLWSIVTHDPVGAIGWPTGADFTRDGVEEVLVVATVDVESTSTDTCVTGQVINCSITVETTYVTSATLRSGADGSQVWTVTREGEEHFERGHSGTPAGYEAWQRVDASNAQVTPYLAGDHDGDGVPDLILNARGFRWDDYVSGYDLFVVGEANGYSRYRYDTESVIVSGATGDETPVRSVLDSIAAADLRPLDRRGGALLWTSKTRPDSTYTCSHGPAGGECVDEKEPETAELEAIDGQTLATRWARSIQPADTPLPLNADLTGDGIAEVFLDERSHIGSELIERGEVVDGATGTTLWGRDGGWYPDVVASMDGGVGADVVRNTSLLEDGETIRLVERIDGATGESLRLTRHTADAQGADDVRLWADLVGDVSGDGVPDIGWRTYRLDHDARCPEDGQPAPSSCWFSRYGTTSELWVEDTVTGELVMPEWTFDGYAIVEAAGDMDGDGRQDLIRIEAGDGPMVYRGLDGPSGQALWTTSFDSLTGLVAAGDQDGDGRDDLKLEAVVEADAARTSHLGSVAGTSGAERWRVRYS